MKNSVLTKIWGGLILLISISLPLLLVSVLAITIYRGQWSLPATPELIKVSILFLFFLVASFFGVRSGLKRLIGKKEIVSVASDVSIDIEIKVSTQLNLNEYLSLSLRLIQERFKSKFAPSALFILFALYIFLLNLSNVVDNIFMFVAPFVIILLIPIFFYRAIKKNYDSSITLSEQIDYTIRIDQIVQKGETFESTISWESIHKAIELKDWFVIYLNEVQVYGLQKKDFTKTEDIVNLREILLSKELLYKV